MQNNNVIVRDILKKFKFYEEALDTGKIISVKDGVARVNGLFGVLSGQMVQFGSPKAPAGSDTQVGSLNRGTEKLIDQKPYIEQLKAGLVSIKIEIMFAAIAALILGCLYLVDTVPTVSPNITMVEAAREMGGMCESGESPWFFSQWKEWVTLGNIKKAISAFVRCALFLVGMSNMSKQNLSNLFVTPLEASKLTFGEVVLERGGCLRADFHDLLTRVELSDVTVQVISIPSLDVAPGVVPWEAIVVATTAGYGIINSLDENQSAPLVDVINALAPLVDVINAVAPFEEINSVETQAVFADLEEAILRALR